MIIDSINLSQQSDSCQEDIDQTIRIEIDSADVQHFFVRITTGGNGWALDIDEIDKIARWLKRVIRRNEKEFAKEIG